MWFLINDKWGIQRIRITKGRGQAILGPIYRRVLRLDTRSTSRQVKLYRTPRLRGCPSSMELLIPASCN